eukprot:5424672-Pleurochrysis_carterae.AAC.1
MQICEQADVDTKEVTAMKGEHGMRQRCAEPPQTAHELVLSAPHVQGRATESAPSEQALTRVRSLAVRTFGVSRLRFRPKEECLGEKKAAQNELATSPFEKNICFNMWCIAHDMRLPQRRCLLG